MTMTTGRGREAASRVVPGTAAARAARPEPDAAAPTARHLTLDGVLSGRGLKAPGMVAFFTTAAGIGARLDLLIGGSLGVGFSATFLLACVLTPLIAQIRSLAATVVTAPLVFAGVTAAAAQMSGQVHGSRALALDVATSLALTAPVLYTGTAVALVVALVRGVTHLVRRRG